MVSTLAELDEKLAQKYGSYTSYRSAADPLLETYGDNPADEVDRLLTIFARPHTTVLDLGCGAGQTLCRIAPQVKAICGFEQDGELLEATRQRVAGLGFLDNVTLVQGDVAQAEDVEPLPNAAFDLLLIRRGPNINRAFLAKLKPDAFLIQERVADSLGLKELFGRKPFLPDSATNPHPLIDNYRPLGFLPVSVKDYFFEQFFTDSEHLAHYLSQGMSLRTWWMPPAPYDEKRDRPALDLYARYNTTAKGIRVIAHRQVYLFRRAEIHFYPAVPDAKPLS